MCLSAFPLTIIRKNLSDVSVRDAAVYGRRRLLYGKSIAGKAEMKVLDLWLLWLGEPLPAVYYEQSGSAIVGYSCFDYSSCPVPDGSPMSARLTSNDLCPRGMLTYVIAISAVSTGCQNSSHRTFGIL